VKPTHDDIRCTVSQLLRKIVFFHGTDARSILTCQIQRRHPDDAQEQDQHERPNKHMTSVVQIVATPVDRLNT
jgi:hypothetical protein